MKDIKLVLDGNKRSTIDLTSCVEGKSLVEQKVLVNAITIKGTDPVFADRGTDMLRKCLSGNIYSKSALKHIGNFAALDTTFFVLENEYKEVAQTGDLLTKVAIHPISFDLVDLHVVFKAIITFADNTITEDISSIAQVN